MLTLSAVALSGAVVWGPYEVEGDQRVEVLRGRVAGALQRPRATIRLIHSGAELRLEDSLVEAGLTDGTVLCVALLPLDDSVTKAYARLFPASTGMAGLSQEEVYARLDAITAACGCDRLPEETSAWLRVLLERGWALGGSLVARPGAIYVDDDLEDEEWECWFIDVRGALGRGAGAVFHGLLDSVSGGTLLHPELAVWRGDSDTPAHYVAADLPSYFAQWADTGCQPARRLNVRG